MSAIDVEKVWITIHTLDRLGQHYPGINSRSARGVLGHAIELEPGAVLPVLGRPHAKKGARPSRYFLPVEREGTRSAEENSRPSLPWVAVTYLRLEQSQQDLIDRLWPRDATPIVVTPTPTPPGTPHPKKGAA